jgi:gamma-glutamylcyclotransferase (GGCT)/AIG2-like uncharacterized protein YtfP
MLYFAYGSNMNLEQMSHRCPNAENLGYAKLKGWGLRERTFADIDPANGEEVHGVLWNISRQHEKTLDSYEGVKRSMYVKYYIPVLHKGKRKRALVYVMTEGATIKRDNGSFTEAYRIGCAIGAIENGVPVDELFSFEKVLGY